MPGPAPKDPKLRQRRNKVVTAKVLEQEASNSAIPELPQRKGNREWRPEAVAFWKEIWSSSMALEYNDVDIQGLHILIDLVDHYWRLPSKEIGKKKELANEIRLQRQCFGLTPLDRMRLQWQSEKTDDLKNKGEKRREDGRKLKKYKVDPRVALETTN